MTGIFLTEQQMANILIIKYTSLMRMKYRAVIQRVRAERVVFAKFPK